MRLTFMKDLPDEYANDAWPKAEMYLRYQEIEKEKAEQTVEAAVTKEEETVEAEETEE